MSKPFARAYRTFRRYLAIDSVTPTDYLKTTVATTVIAAASLLVALSGWALIEAPVPGFLTDSDMSLAYLAVYFGGGLFALSGPMALGFLIWAFHLAHGRGGLILIVSGSMLVAASSFLIKNPMPSLIEYLITAGVATIVAFVIWAFVFVVRGQTVRDALSPPDSVHHTQEN